VGSHGIRVDGGSAAALGWGPLTQSTTSRAVPVADEAAGGAFDQADDRSLVDAFVAGHREAFGEIVRRHRRRLYQVCYRFTGNHDDAADLAQDALVRAFKGLARFKHESSLSTWLYRVAVNTCLNHASATRPDTEPVDAVERPDTRAIDPLDAVERGEARSVVQRAIRQLPPRQRATVILRVYHELSHEEIAAVLGSTVGASKTNFFHALENLRRLIGP
jgi:RNA polymerase sigma-70 factor (ECF subfamily)